VTSVCCRGPSSSLPRRGSPCFLVAGDLPCPPPMRSISDWWGTQQAARDLHSQLRATPMWTQWRVPCDVASVHDAHTARVVMLLLQKYPNHYRVLWGAKSLTIYHTEAYEAVAGKPDRDLLARWGLQLRPRRDAEGIPAPPPQAGGRQFDLEGERCDPAPAGGGSPVEIEVVRG